MIIPLIKYVENLFRKKIIDIDIFTGKLYEDYDLISHTINDPSYIKGHKFTAIFANAEGYLILMDK